MNELTEKTAFLSARFNFLVCFVLAALIFSVYFQVKDHDFVSFDDNWYVAENFHVRSGLSLENIKWSFKLQKTKASHWHPVTWMSHMLDCQLFGLDPGMHHLSSLFIHGLTTILIFLLLNKMTGAVFRSVLVAALFALHPLSVNSVAWIAERKNVLSAFFWAATILTYIYYVKKPSLFKYLSAVFLFVLGLMSKPMIITLPFTLLLLDFWPLDRFKLKGKKLFSRLVLEKVPFFLLLIVFFLIYNSAFSGDNFVSMDMVSMKLRAENALVSYVRYIELIIWPHDLAVFYPYPSEIPLWKVLSSGLFIVLVSLIAFLKLKKYPYLFTGWFWYLGTLVPALGLKQVGLWPAMADRFVYIPMVGIFIIAVWGFNDLVSGLRFRNVVTGTAVVIVFAFFIPQTCTHLKTWKNSISLFENDLKVTRKNYIMHNNFGLALEKENRTDEAFVQFEKSLQINPYYVKAHNNLGKLFLEQGRADEAIKHFTFVLEREPGNVKAHNNLGTVLAKTGQKDEAIRHFLAAVEQDPGFSHAFINLCGAYIETGDLDRAVMYCKKAIDIEPDIAKGYYTLGLAFERKGLIEKAIEYYSRAIDLAPDMADAHTNLAISYSKENRLDQAIDHFKIVVNLNPGAANAYNNLGFAYFLAGRFDEAESCFGQVLQIEPDNKVAKQNIQKVLAAKGLVAQ